jgi:hypothetical protein
MPRGAALRLSPNGAQYVTFKKRFLIFKFGAPIVGMLLATNYFQVFKNKKRLMIMDVSS